MKRSKWKAYRRSLAALATVAATPGAVQASDDWWASAGIQAAFSFGHGPLKVGLGIDLRASWIFDGDVNPCDNSLNGGLGPYAQVHFFSDGVRLGAGVHGGSELADGFFTWDLEGGWTYRTAYNSKDGGHGIQGGLTLQGPLAEVTVRGTKTWAYEEVSEGHVGVGLRIPGTFGAWGFCIGGRPLRLEQGITTAPCVVAAGPRRPMRLERETRSALGRAWLADARAEAASVPAFVALARDLAHAGAPRSLFRRAQVAVRDEVRHARDCAALAGAYAGATVVPLQMAPPRAVDRDRPALLRRLAVESWLDGCIAEGAAAGRARRAVGAARGRVRDVLSGIARDEGRHADLGWHVLDWCLAEGRRDVRAAVRQVVEGPLPAPTPEPSGPEPKSWARHGRLGSGASDAAWDETIERAMKRGARI